MTFFPKIIFTAESQERIYTIRPNHIFLSEELDPWWQKIRLQIRFLQNLNATGPGSAKCNTTASEEGNCWCDTCQPFDVRDFLLAGQLDGELFIVIFIFKRGQAFILHKVLF